MVQFLFEAAFSLFVGFVLLPVILICATPFILVSALFSKDPYRVALAKRYRRVIGIWAYWGAITP